MSELVSCWSLWLLPAILMLQKSIPGHHLLPCLSSDTIPRGAEGNRQGKNCQLSETWGSPLWYCVPPSPRKRWDNKSDGKTFFPAYAVYTAAYEERPRGLLFCPLNRGKSGEAG